jgi:hypothetical protein
MIKLIKAQYAISYADAFVVALAQELQAKIVTANPEFKKVESLPASYSSNRQAKQRNAGKSLAMNQLNKEQVMEWMQSLFVTPL